MDLQKMNETQIPFWGCSRTPDNSSLNSSALEVNATCSNASIIQKFKPTRPKEMDSVRIILYSLVFLLSVFGNLLIIVVLIVNKRMRTVTNSFLLSLAVSDLMMAIFCMPFNLIPSLLEDFIFGAAMCKTVAYFMGISVSISTFSLVAIAIERYSAICNPLKSRAWQTRSHAYKVIAATWALSVGIMVPYPVFSILVPFNKPNNITAHMCRLDWPISQVEQSWYVLLLLILFFIPGLVMIIAYGLISRELYRGIQFEMEQKKESSVFPRSRSLPGASAPPWWAPPWRFSALSAPHWWAPALPWTSSAPSAPPWWSAVWLWWSSAPLWWFAAPSALSWWSSVPPILPDLSWVPTLPATPWLSVPWHPA
ncbi:cholecystokinin receptor-like isoform X3 [Onychostoma macrolepis]|uniref:cholecystokinin receptor-like isoform X3 n=1 Tax=Onychostoma macrolepis TaxID=369639 RepID=UPI002729ED0D|nr:cholecystokinin receptor-like isoform X3 [Onychostoma macrolepis]